MCIRDSVYSNATILGRITIGRDATVGGNIWVTENVPAGARICLLYTSEEFHCVDTESTNGLLQFLTNEGDRVPYQIMLPYLLLSLIHI